MFVGEVYTDWGIQIYQLVNTMVETLTYNSSETTTTEGNYSVWTTSTNSASEITVATSNSSYERVTTLASTYVSRTQVGISTTTQMGFDWYYPDGTFAKTIPAYTDFETSETGENQPIVSYYAGFGEVLAIISSPSWIQLSECFTTTSFTSRPSFTYYNSDVPVSVGYNLMPSVSVISTVSKSAATDRFPINTVSTPPYHYRGFGIGGTVTFNTAVGRNSFPGAVDMLQAGFRIYQNVPIFKAEIPSIPFNTRDKSSGALWYTGSAEVTIPKWSHVAGGRLNNLIPYPVGTSSVVTATTNATGGFDAIGSDDYTTITVSFNSVGNCFSTWSVTDSRNADSANTVTSSVKTSSGSMMLTTSESYPAFTSRFGKYLNWYDQRDASYFILGGMPEFNRDYTVFNNLENLPAGACAVVGTSGNALSTGSYSTIYGTIADHLIGQMADAVSVFFPTPLVCGTGIIARKLYEFRDAGSELNRFLPYYYL